MLLKRKRCNRSHFYLSIFFVAVHFKRQPYFDKFASYSSQCKMVDELFPVPNVQIKRTAPISIPSHWLRHCWESNLKFPSQPSTWLVNRPVVDLVEFITCPNTCIRVICAGHNHLKSWDATIIPCLLRSLCFLAGRVELFYHLFSSFWLCGQCYGLVSS